METPRPLERKIPSTEESFGIVGRFVEVMNEDWGIRERLYRRGTLRGGIFDGSAVRNWDRDSKFLERFSRGVPFVNMAADAGISGSAVQSAAYHHLERLYRGMTPEQKVEFQGLDLKAIFHQAVVYVRRTSRAEGR